MEQFVQGQRKWKLHGEYDLKDYVLIYVCVANPVTWIIYSATPDENIYIYILSCCRTNLASHLSSS